ncbi:MotA/TolQ/ExbB proton channel family protein [Poriferisphaera sp. WC338]|uniref:MotA/TolQ/ExbB proton channel family protein n=1 Tax=Poriferisphaera sp. WC338 TaxID=3425129 RepID=UPI003D81AB80
MNIPAGMWSKRMWAIGGAATLSITITSSGLAQPATEKTGTTINAATGALPTLQQLFMYSPWINGIIAILSLIGIAMFLGFWLSVNARYMVPNDFVDEVTKLVLRKKYDAASDLCRANRRIFCASIIQRCCENAGKGQSVIMDMIDTEGKRRADMVWNRVSYLADISNVAPMLGLLGTVVGMIKAFFGLEQQTGSINAMVLSQGVGQAMATTMFGLVVGIGALVGYTIIKGRATSALAEAESVVHSLADHIKRDSEALATTGDDGEAA